MFSAGVVAFLIACGKHPFWREDLEDVQADERPVTFTAELLGYDMSYFLNNSVSGVPQNFEEHTKLTRMIL